MKKIIKKLLSLLLLSTLLIFNGCDELANLPINVPIEITFTTGGTNTSLSESASFCLSEYQEWSDNQESITSATFVSAAYWTTSATSGLKGDITISLSDQFGNQLFSVTLENVQVADNIDTPYTLALTEEEIQAVDEYLSLLSENENDQCFNSNLTIENISADSTPYQLSGRVELVIEAAVKL